jgi:hypothetical protein
VILNGSSFRFNRSFLAASARSISFLLLSDPLATSITINDSVITEDSLLFLTSRTAPLTTSTVLSVAALGIALQSDSLFDFAIRSPSFASLQNETRVVLLELAFTFGLDIRGAFGSPDANSLISLLSPHIIRYSAYFCQISAEQRCLVSPTSTNLNLIRSHLPPPPRFSSGLQFVKQIDFDRMAPFSGIFSHFEKKIHFFKSAEFPLILKVDSGFHLEVTDLCVRIDGDELSPDLELLAWTNATWRKVGLCAPE